MSETIFILGREPALSVAELEAVTPQWAGRVILASAEAVVAAHRKPLEITGLRRLGGSQKMAKVIDRWPIDDKTPWTDRLTVAWLQEHGGPTMKDFGWSLYGGSRRQAEELGRKGLQLKQGLKKLGVAARFVVSRQPQLSAVVIERNGLLKHGREFVFVQTPKEVIVGVTTAIQDYRDYGLRDFGRPAADPKSGMLPPKVAQIMLNLANVQANDVILDPFCGSGTILQEAALLGVKNIFGSDSIPKAVKDAQTNIRWLFKEYPHVHASIEVTLTDARRVNVKPNVIVTEPYLGKPLRGHEPDSFLQFQMKELERTYVQAMTHWATIMKPGGRVVMIWPEFVTSRGSTVAKIDDVVAGLGFSREPLLSAENAKTLNQGDRFVLKYGRPGAKVVRQIRMWVQA